LLELLIGLIARARVKGSFSNLEITSKLSNNGENGIPQKQTSKKLVFNLLVIGVSLLEEIIFRGFVLQYLLSNDIPLVLSIAISSIAFGVNHFFRGPLAIIQKTNAGAVFGVLTILGSFSLYIPIATHIGENYVILAFKEIKKRLDNRETRND
jgi:membrane protease YdiL (CAAX protease family)